MLPRLSIGEFSSATHLSVRTLRRYHASGLLVPAEIDPWNGYRYYTPGQIAQALTVRRLRELDLPVREIADLMGDPDEQRRHAVLATHLGRLEQRLEQTEAAVHALRRLIDQDEVPLGVEVRQVGELITASITATIDLEAVLGWYATAMTELDAALGVAGRSPTGPPGALLDPALFTVERGSLTVFVPLTDPPISGRVAPLTMSAGALAVAVHRGDHGVIDVTYGRLAEWMLAQGFPIRGPVRETYLIGPRDTPHPADWRTEIAWPVVERRDGPRAT